ncbi:PEP-utilizing enzyme [Halobellus sp. GM3]|uniref:PEP-utilizing enzyme n=1 Tax=Halobellus sp. GM3 TaxID=3458410 RepID=UPI00403DD127
MSDNTTQSNPTQDIPSDRFPWPDELDIPPELEGSEEMYPDFFQFGRNSDRASYERDLFWFYDKKDTSEPILPWDATISAEAAHMTSGQNLSRVFAIPPNMSLEWRIVGGYFYVSPVSCSDEELLTERTEVFTERSDYFYENFDALYHGIWKPRVKEIGDEIASLDVPDDLPRYVPEETVIEAKGQSQDTLTLIRNYNRLTELVMEAWQRHFEYLYLVYFSYLSFRETCYELFPGISDDAVGKMVSGMEADLFRPDEELNTLAKLAVDIGGEVVDILTSEDDPATKRKRLSDAHGGDRFLEALDDAKDPWFYVSYGDGFHSSDGSWIDDMVAPYQHLSSKIERLQSGESIGRDFDQLQAERDEIVEEYRGYLGSDAEREQFDKAHRTCLDVYEYAEDHQFWVEHRLHTIIFQKMREFGALVASEGLLDDPEDIFMFTKFEVAELLEEVCETWGLGPQAHTPIEWKQTAENRRKMMDAAREWSPPPALGEPPEEITDPLVVMLWGITTETVEEWLDDDSEEDQSGQITGFGSSNGTVTGKARIVRNTGELDDLEDGEIIVCPRTSPAWAPVFPRIKGAVTDDGGITSHAAIVCREYGTPAVTGTGSATDQIETGDIVQVDGEAGEVEILERAVD